MKLEIQKITLKNFLSYKESEFEFNKKGFIQVIGENRTITDLSLSNGTGKSSLFNAIIWALYGITASGIKDPQSIYNDETCEVALYFSLNNQKIKIIRSKRPSKLELFVDNKNVSGKGIRDTEKIVEQYLGNLTHDVVNSVVIFGQGLPHRLSSLSPAGRKELLEKLSQSDYMIEDLKNKVNQREDVLKQEKRSNEDGILVTKNNITNQTYSLTQLKNKKAELDNLDIQSLTKEFQSLNTTLLKERLKEITTQITSLDDLIQTNLQKLTQISQEQPLLIDVSKENQELIQLRALLTSKQSELKRLEEIKTTCPTCKQNLPHAHKPDTTELKNEIQRILEQGKSLKQTYDELVEKNNQTTLLFNQELNNKKSIIQQENQTHQNKKGLLQQEEREIHSQINQIQVRKATLELQIKNHQQDLENVNQSILNSEKEIKQFQSTLEEYEQSLTKIEESISIVGKMNTLLKRDFRGILLTNVLNFLQSRLDYYANEVFNCKELKIEINGTNLDISFKQKIYESLSGGEKTKIDIILQLAIRDLLINQFNFNSNILVVDEVTDFLDEQGAERIYQLFTNLNVEQIYIISHRKDFTFPVDNQLHIIKEDNYSRILEK